MRHELTADGSSTLFAENFNAHYHSTHGAIAESEHVFIRAGLDFLPKGLKLIHVLEYGFGTGLNAYLAATYAETNHREINYQSIEAYPVATEMVSALNYNERYPSSLSIEKFHCCLWGQEIELARHFKLTKHFMPFVKFESSKEFDIIFYDAFAPATQEELWTKDAMRTCYNQLKTNGILVTFCAKGSFKRALKEVGFRIESIPGPPGKREMTRAIKSL